MSTAGAADPSVDVRRRTASGLIDALPEPLALLSEDGAILHANPRLARLLDAEPGALDDRPFADVTAEGDVDELLRRWRATSAAVPGGATLRRVDGSEVPVRADGCWQPETGLILVRIRDRAGAADGFSRLRDEVETENLRQLRDRLQRALAEQADANARLARVNEDLDRYAAIVSHDLRAPLALIRSSIELARDPRSDEEGEELLDVAERAAIQMGQVIEQLLTLARLGDAQPPAELTDPSGSLDDVLRTYAHELRETAAEVVADRLPPVAVQPTHLRQAFQNLLSNAIRFRREHDPPTIEFRGHVRDDGKVVIAVSDNGVGIARDERERVFEPMVRGSNVGGREGTGLGLAVVRRICRAYGGEARVVDRDGPGTTFVLELPGSPGP